MNKELEAIDAVSRAVERVKRVGRGAELTLSNGIVLKAKSVPPYLSTAVQDEFKAPPPPKVMIEEKGREEENPNDPAYLRELEELNDKQMLALNDLYLGLGTEVISVPEGYFRPEDDGWIEGVEFAQHITNTHFKIDRDDKIKRYLHWLRFYALENSVDLILAVRIPSELAGITEGEVDEVINSFRSLPGRRTDTGSASEAGNQNGHTANRAARRARS